MARRSPTTMDPRGRDHLLRRLGSTLYTSQGAAERGHFNAAPAAASSSDPRSCSFWSGKRSLARAHPSAASSDHPRTTPARGQRHAATHGAGTNGVGLSRSRTRRPCVLLDATESAAEIALPTLKPRVAMPKTSTEMPVVVVFDLETTGLSKDRNRIIELAAVNATNPSQAPMSTLVNPGRFNIPPRWWR